MKIGTGYDIHKLEKERKLIIGGVLIPFELGLLGHSDADVLVHSIIDCLLGAMGEYDIGHHFPDNDEKYKNINSLELLKKTKELLNKNNYKIINIDSNIICQKPKLMPYIDLMRKNIADCLDISINLISIKAKTNENMDAVGNLKAISANAVCLIDEK